MSTSIANISWAPVAGSYGTKVEYKLHTDTTWITPVSPANPTLSTTYPLTITDGVTYDVRLTTISNGRCGASGTTFQIITGVSSCCPATYTLSVDGTYCYKTSTTVATPPSSSENTVAESYFTYGCWGTILYNPGYSSNGVGSFTTIPTTNPFWINGPGYPATGNYIDGPVNRSALWATTVTSSQTVGFTVCVNLPVDATYLVAIAGDNIPKITLDGNVIIDMDPTALGTYMASHGYPGIIAYPDEAAFRFWNVYPVFMNAGVRVLEMTCFNISGPAAMAAEIYNATGADLAAAGSYASLGAKLIFSTKDYIGQPVQIGSGGIGYTCPPGYALVLCDGPAYCTQTLTNPTIPC